MDSGNNRNLLAAGLAPVLAEAVGMLSPLETGTTPGGDPGNVGGAGKPVPRTGVWHRRAARGASEARQLAGLAWRGRARPLHLIHGGASPDSGRPDTLRSGHIGGLAMLVAGFASLAAVMEGVRKVLLLGSVPTGSSGDGEQRRLAQAGA